MWSYSSSITRLKIAIPYLFASKVHRTMWAIGAFALFATVAPLSLHSSKATQTSYDKVQPVDIKLPSANSKTSANQSDIVETSTNTSAQPDQSRSSSTVRINNQSIQLPPNGSIHKTIQSDDGQTKLNVSIDTSSTTDNQSNSSTSVQLNMSSEQETTIENSE